MYLVDTNVLSELPKKSPDPAVLAWFASLATIAMSSISLEELTFGVERARGKGPVMNNLIGSASRRADLRGAKSTGYCCYLEISQRRRRRWIGAEAVKLFVTGP
ncbi:MAG: PIN domain-containing protein [Polyangiaceae bacterium]|nr:PIN domain-containing protein [Polyangiaceae bacterium]